MATPAQILRDPEFHQLPVEEQRYVLGKVDPEFLRLPAQEQQYVLGRARLAAPQPSIDPTEAANRELAGTGISVSPPPSPPLPTALQPDAPRRPLGTPVGLSAVVPRMESPEARRGFARVQPSPVARGLASGAAGVGMRGMGGLAQLAGSQLKQAGRPEVAPWVPESPEITQAEPIAEADPRLPASGRGQEFLQVLGSLSEEAGVELSEAGEAVQQAMALPRELQVDPFEDPTVLTKPEWWGHVGGTALGSMIPIVLTAMASRGNPAVVAAVLEAAAEGGIAFEEAKKSGADDDRAADAAARTAAGTGLTAVALNRAGIFTERTKNLLGRGILGGSAESVQELSQELWADLVARGGEGPIEEALAGTGYDPERQIGAGAGTALAGGFLGGGIVGPLVGLAERQQPPPMIEGDRRRVLDLRPEPEQRPIVERLAPTEAPAPEPEAARPRRPSQPERRAAVLPPEIGEPPTQEQLQPVTAPEPAAPPKRPKRSPLFGRAEKQVREELGLSKQDHAALPEQERLAVRDLVYERFRQLKARERGEPPAGIPEAQPPQPARAEVPVRPEPPSRTIATPQPVEPRIEEPRPPEAPVPRRQLPEPAGRPTAPEAEPAEKPAAAAAPEQARREPSVPPEQGREATVLVPGAQRKYRTRYQVRDMADVEPSADPVTLEDNPRYAYRNDRNYRDRRNATRILEDVMRFEESYHLADSPTGEHGPPIIDPAGNVLGGNRRAIVLKRLRQQNPEAYQRYREGLKEQAAKFGVDPARIDEMEAPMLVRQVAEDEQFDPQTAITDFNEPGVAALTPSEQASTTAARVSQETLDRVAGRMADLGEKATLAQVLEGAEGVAIVDQLIEEGAVARSARANLLNEKGELTAAAKDRVSKALLGRVFRDPAQYDRTPARIRNNLERAMPHIVRVEARPDWAVTQDVQDAIDILEHARATGIKNLDDLATQQRLPGAEAPNVTPRAIALARKIQEGPIKAAKAFRQYANEARLSEKGQTATLFDPPNPQDSFDAIFGDGSTLGPQVDLLPPKAQLQPRSPEDAVTVEFRQSRALGAPVLWANNEAARLMLLPVSQFPKDFEFAGAVMYEPHINRAVDQIQQARQNHESGKKRLRPETLQILGKLESALGQAQRHLRRTGDAGIVVLTSGRGVPLTRATLRHEGTHLRIARDLGARLLKNPRRLRAFNDAGAQAWNRLRNEGYQPDQIPEEIFVRLAAGQAETLGAGMQDPAQRNAWLLELYRAVREEHGQQKAQRLLQLLPENAFAAPAEGIKARQAFLEGRPPDAERPSTPETESERTGEAVGERRPEGARPQAGRVRGRPDTAPVAQGKRRKKRAAKKLRADQRAQKRIVEVASAVVSTADPTLPEAQKSARQKALQDFRDPDSPLRKWWRGEGRKRPEGFAKRFFYGYWSKKFIAEQDRHFRPFFEREQQAVKEHEERVARVFEPLRDSYYALPYDGIDRINEALEKMRLDRRKNKGRDQQEVIDEYTKDLKQEEKEAVTAVRRAMDQVFGEYENFIVNLATRGKLTSAKAIQSLKDMEKALAEAEISEGARGRLAQSAWKALENVREQYAQFYVPFMRFGDWFAGVRRKASYDKHGNLVQPEETIHLEAVENWELGGSIGVKTKEMRAHELAGKLRNDPRYKDLLEAGDAEIVAPYQRPELKFFEKDLFGHEDLLNLEQIVKLDPELAKKLSDLIEDAQQAQKRLGFRAHFLRARDVPGYERKLERSIGAYIQAASRSMSRITMLRDMEIKLKELPRNRPKLIEAVEDYMHDLRGNRSEGVLLRSALFHFHLGFGNIKSPFVNTTQVMQLTLPWMTRHHGFRRADRQLRRAYKDVLAAISPSQRGFDFGKLPEDVREAVIKSHQDGTLKEQFSREIGEIGRGAHRRGRDIPVIRVAVQKIKKDRTGRISAEDVKNANAALFKAAEHLNRITSFIGAYRAYQVNPVKGFKDALEYAEDVVNVTQGIYERGNRPAWMAGGRSAVGRKIKETATVFMMYPQIELELVARLAKGTLEKNAAATDRWHRISAVGAYAGVKLAWAGMKGLPGVAALSAIGAMLHQFFTGEELDEDNWAMEILTGIMNMPGAMADWAWQGPSRHFLPVDLSRSMQAEIPIASQATDILNALRGHGEITDVTAASGFAARTVKGAHELLKGEPRGLESLLPTGPAGIAKAARIAEEGIRTRAGREVVPAEDLGPLDILLRGAGFPLSKESKAWDQFRWERSLAQAPAGKKSALVDQMARGLLEGDLQAVWDAMEEAENYNASRPPHRQIPIPELIESAKRREKEMRRPAEEQRFRSTPKAYRPFLQENPWAEGQN